MWISLEDAMSHLADKPHLEDLPFAPSFEISDAEVPIVQPESEEKPGLIDLESGLPVDSSEGEAAAMEKPSILADIRRFRSGEVPLWKAFWVYFALGSMTSLILSVVVDLGTPYLTEGEDGFFPWLVSFVVKLSLALYPVFAGLYTSRIAARKRLWIQVLTALALCPVVITAGLGILFLLVGAGYSLGSMNFAPSNLATVPVGC
jgi:hypothetical protein